MATQYIVRKPFVAGAELLPSGQVVDPSAWRNRQALIAGRFIEAVKVDESPAPKAQAKQKGKQNANANKG